MRTPAAGATVREHSDRRVWHQAMATWGADQQVGGGARGLGPALAATRGALIGGVRPPTAGQNSSMDQDRRVSRVTAAAAAAWDAGQPDRAREAIAQALPAASGSCVSGCCNSAGNRGNGAERAGALPQLLEGRTQRLYASLRRDARRLQLRPRKPSAGSRPSWRLRAGRLGASHDRSRPADGRVARVDSPGLLG